MSRRPEWRRLRTHRSYSVDEAARTLCVCKATVRRWIRDKDLPVLDDTRPTLILGRELIAFGKAQRKPKQKCRPMEAYCMSCRAPRKAAFNAAEISSANAASANLRMLCVECSGLIHRRYGWQQLVALNGQMKLTSSQAHRSLIETIQPCLNVHYEKDE